MNARSSYVLSYGVRCDACREYVTACVCPSIGEPDRGAARQLPPPDTFLSPTSAGLAYRARCDLPASVVDAYSQFTHSRPYIERLLGEQGTLWLGGVVARPALLTDVWAIHFAGRCADWSRALSLA